MKAYKHNKIYLKYHVYIYKINLDVISKWDFYSINNQVLWVNLKIPQ